MYSGSRLHILPFGMWSLPACRMMLVGVLFAVASGCFCISPVSSIQFLVVSVGVFVSESDVCG